MFYYSADGAKQVDAFVSLSGAAFGILIAAINTIANICVSPFINAIGKNNDIHPYRRANIFATTICSFPFFLPYGGCVLLLLGGIREMEYVLNNMVSSITGMICDGGNQGCTMKGVAACDTAFRSVEFAMKGVHIDKAHGINGATAEDTMRNMGLIASPGMVQTEKTIVEIFENKLR